LTAPRGNVPGIPTHQQAPSARTAPSAYSWACRPIGSCRIPAAAAPDAWGAGGGSPAGSAPSNAVALDDSEVRAAAAAALGASHAPQAAPHLLALYGEAAQEPPARLAVALALRDFPVLPRSAFVSGDGRRIVVVDTYLENDRKSPGFLLLDATGAELRRYPIGDLMDADHVEQTTSSIWWYAGDACGFSADDRRFVLGRRGGSRLVFDVERGDRSDSAPDLQAASQAAEDAPPPADKTLLERFVLAPSAQPVLAAITGAIRLAPAGALHLLRNHPQQDTAATLHAEVRRAEWTLAIQCPLQARQRTLTLEFDWRSWQIRADRLVSALQAWRAQGAARSPSRASRSPSRTARSPSRVP